jgi:hypothetical protein
MKMLKFLIPLLLVGALALPPIQSLYATPQTGSAATIPTFSIIGVVRDQTVTIRTNNFPANQTFTARMGPMGTRGIGGTVVGTVESGAGGTFEATFNVPAGLRSSHRIAIRLDSPAGFFAFNWFFNSTTAVVPPGTPVPTPAPGTPAPTPTPRHVSIPTFSIVGVERDQTVTIRTNNFPANQTFTARMGPMGTRGIGGTVVGTVDSGAGGTFEATFNVPAGLRSSHRIAIRLDSPAGFFAFNWFFNTTTAVVTPGTPVPTPAPGTPAPTPTPRFVGIPTFSIVGVARDQSVTIRTNNFPPNQTFTARMGPIGTRGIGGTVVGTVDSGAGGTFEASFDVPAGLRSARQIAIRLDSPAGFFAYNWFFNTTHP